jgi:hypothetical protein
MIYVRSRRPIVSLGASAFGCMVFFGMLAFGATRVPGGIVAALALGAGSLGGALVSIWSAVRLHAWPWGKLALFRDRVLVIQGRTEMRAVWEHMESVTLANPGAWPDIKMTDTLTINLRKEPAIRFKPAWFGLEASGCRDLVLRLRDDMALRERLPVFDSDRDLAAAPVVAGELLEPRF